MRTIVLATRNPGKVHEIGEILAGVEAELRPIDAYPGVPDVVEDGADYQANAVKKALAAARATGELALADDSGLEVDALGGRPGLHSARYAGPRATGKENVAKLLRELAEVEVARRGARFRCVVALAAPAGGGGASVQIAFGTVEGTIIAAPRGAGGFGYDPVFLLANRGLTMAELPGDEKNRVSHRARALLALRPALEDALAAAASRC